MVALPVQLMVRAPGPKYSMMLLVPPGDGQHTGQIENNVLGRRPAPELAGEANADASGVHDLPRKAGHDVRAVRAANANGEHSQAAGVRGVGVGADHQAAREGVVLQHHLVDDTRAGFPESHAVLGRGRLEKLVDLAVLKQCVGGVGPASHARLNQMVAVDGGGDGHATAARLHELEYGHLAGNVLVGHPVGT